jgi:undecaprenyl-diphosphatase
MSEHPHKRLDHRAILAGAWRFFQYRFRSGGRYGLGFTIAFAATIFALAAFLQIVDELAEQETVYHLDMEIRALMVRVVSPELTPWVVRVTNVGSVPFTSGLVVLVGVILLLRRQWWRMLELVFATAMGGLLVLVLKGLFQRSRPLEALVDAHGYSFPSGHAFGSTVFFGMLIRLAWSSSMPLFGRVSATLLCVLAVVLISTSRVYLGVHWLTDVMGGVTAGLTWLVACLIIVRVVEPWKPRGGAGGEPVAGSGQPPASGGQRGVS